MHQRGRAPLPLDLPLPADLQETAHGSSKQAAVYSALRDAILNGIIRVGSQVPSTRALATRWRVARGTVELAYERLCVEGYVRREHGAGTFVNANIPESYLLPRQPVERQLGVRIEPKCPYHASDLRAASVGIPFVARLPDPALFPWKEWSRHLKTATATVERGGFDEADPAGMIGLREEIVRYLREYRNIECDASSVFVTSGIRHGIDLVSRAFLDVGDKVAVEDPGYAFARRIFELSKLNVASIPVGPQGIETDRLREHPDAKMVFVTPAHQSPLGITMSVNRRLELTDWAEQHGAIIFEDDYDSDFSYSGSPLSALTSIDRSGRTIYCGGFNKSAFPSIRIGFVVAKGSFQRQLQRVWDTLGRSVGATEQTALRSLLADGGFARHLRLARNEYAKRRDRLLVILEEQASGLFSVTGHDAGFHFALWLADDQDELALCERAREVGIELQPLSSLCHSVKLPPGVIIGYSALTMRQIDEYGIKLASVLRNSNSR